MRRFIQLFGLLMLILLLASLAMMVETPSAAAPPASAGVLSNEDQRSVSQEASLGKSKSEKPVSVCAIATGSATVYVTSVPLTAIPTPTPQGRRNDLARQTNLPAKRPNIASPGRAKGQADEPQVIPTSIPTPILSFPGISNSDNPPGPLPQLAPDTNGAVSPSYFVQSVNHCTFCG